MNQADEESLVPPNLVVNEERGHAMVEEDALEETFYADCDQEEVTLAKSLLRPEPMATFTTPVETTDERFGSIPRIYIECLEDRAISPEAQEEMYTTLPCETVRSLETSHSPFLSAPDALADHLRSV